MLKAAQAFVLSALVGVALTTAAMAQDGPYTTFHVKVEENPAQTTVSPEANGPVTKDRVSFHVMNNTNEELYFMAGDEKFYVPMVSENTFTVPYMMGDAYKAVDADGNVLATWHVQEGAMATGANTEWQSKYTNWGSTLQTVMQNNNYVAAQPYQQQETESYRSTTMTETRSTERGTTVRGYW